MRPLEEAGARAGPTLRDRRGLSEARCVAFSGAARPAPSAAPMSAPPAAPRLRPRLRPAAPALAGVKLTLTPADYPAAITTRPGNLRSR